MNPSKRYQDYKSPRTEKCRSCKWEFRADPTERPCNECTRSTYWKDYLKQNYITRIGEHKYWKDYWRNKFV